MSPIKKTASFLGIEPRAVLGLVVIIAGLGIWLLAFSGFFKTVFAPKTYTVRAAFTSIEDISPGDPVRVNGIQVGTVSKLSPSSGGRTATLTMAMNSDQPVYADANAAIVWKTILGGIDAVQLTPGTSAAGQLGSAVIPASRDANQVELDQITQQAFDGGAPTGIQTMMAQLPIALDEDPNVLKDDFYAITKVAPWANVGIGALRGVDQDTDLRNLVKNAASTAQALDVGSSASETRQFIESAANVVDDVSYNPTALKATVDEIDSIIPYAHANFHVLNDSLYRANPLIDKLKTAAPTIAPTFTTLHPTLVQADTLLQRVKPLLNTLQPAVDQVASASTTGVPVIGQLAPALDNLNNTFLPGMEYKDPEDGGRPTADAIGGTALGLGDVASFFDSNHHLANLTAGLPATSPDGLAGFLPCTTNFSGTDLLTCESLSDSLGLVETSASTLVGDLNTNPTANAQYRAERSEHSALAANLQTVLGKLDKVAPNAVAFLTKAVAGVKK